MRPPKLSVSLLLLTITGALTLMIATLSFKDLYANINRMHQLELLRQASAFGDQMFDAAEKLSLERDLSTAALIAPNAEDANELRPRLTEVRAAVDPAIAAALANSHRYQFAELTRLRVAIAERMTRIQRLRQQTDAVLAHRNARQARALADEWPREVGALTDETESVWLRFTARFIDIDPIVTLHLRFKHLLRSIRNESAMERALIAQAIAQPAGPTPQQVAELLRAEGAAEADWHTSQAIAEQSGLMTTIARPYADARSHFATMRDMTQNLYATSGPDFHSLFPMGPDLWFELSNQASTTFQGLTSATVHASQSYLDTLTRRAQQAIVGQVVMLILAMLLCAASFWVVIVRVVGPINEIVVALLKTMRGEAVNVPATPGRQDEIGKLAQVLEAFRANTTEVRRTAEELTQNQMRLRAVVDHAMDGLITIDERGAIQSFNPACERMFGYRADEIIGRPITLLIPSLYAEGDPGDLASYVADPSAAASHEASGRRKNRSSFQMDLTVSTYVLSGATYYLAIVRDVTLRKEAELALLGYTHALERSNRELDDFAYIASHDLKEPLRGIHNHSRFLLEDNEKSLDEESAKRLHRLVYLSQRMERLVNDLLYFSRLGRQELAVQPMDMAAAVRDIEATLEHFLEERGARIVVKGELPSAVCDKPRVTEVVRNLITNAVKYNDKAEKVVEIGFVESRSRPTGKIAHNVYYVRDNGRGIDPEFHSDVFRIFKRLQAGEGAEDGTGVGLTFVKKIVERHGGEIWIESEVGRGATFYFTLEASHDDSRISPEAA